MLLSQGSHTTVLPFVKQHWHDHEEKGIPTNQDVHSISSCQARRSSVRREETIETISIGGLLVCSHMFHGSWESRGAPTRQPFPANKAVFRDHEEMKRV